MASTEADGNSPPFALTGTETSEPIQNGALTATISLWRPPSSIRRIVFAFQISN